MVASRSVLNSSCGMLTVLFVSHSFSAQETASDLEQKVNETGLEVE